MGDGVRTGGRRSGPSVRRFRRSPRRCSTSWPAFRRGCVLTYGDVAEYVGTGSARSVGAVLRRHGHEVPWQRVVLATGAPAPAAPQRALLLLRCDGAPLVPAGDRVDLARARWDGRPGSGRPG